MTKWRCSCRVAPWYPPDAIWRDNRRTQNALGHRLARSRSARRPSPTCFRSLSTFGRGVRRLARYACAGGQGPTARHTGVQRRGRNGPPGDFDEITLYISTSVEICATDECHAWLESFVQGNIDRVDAVISLSQEADMDQAQKEQLQAMLVQVQTLCVSPPPPPSIPASPTKTSPWPAPSSACSSQ